MRPTIYFANNVPKHYIMPIHLSTSLRFATTISSISMPMPMYSARIMKFSDGLRRVIIS